MKKSFIAFGMFLLLAFAVQLNAQIPRTLSYQGILTDNAGKPRPDGNYQFTFCLYDTATGGAPLWTEQKILPVKGGLFSTILGDATPFGAAVKFDKAYWLGIRVGNEVELSPRIPLTSVGYSMSAARADTAFFSMNSYAGIDTTWNKNGDNLYRLQGNVGIGTSVPQVKLHIVDNDTARFAIEALRRLGPIEQILFKSFGTVQWALQAKITNTFGHVFRTFAIYPGDPRKCGHALLIDAETGIVKVPVLEIQGGSDLAEPFEISHADSLPVGSLVVIDPEQPGKLKQATEPYDKRVAGVISGAGGINPGLTLTQAGKLTGSQHVALTGKVYALATAANGAIEPGDLLTTSSIPGHAMKATNHKRAFGTVIGKAMSALENGKGLVLVLVNLQ